jgi:hypothetical protein
VQTVTTWVTAGSVVAAAALTIALAHGTTAAASTSNSGTSDQNQATNPNGGNSVGGDQLQAPQYLPGAAGGQGRHGSTGGS